MIPAHGGYKGDVDMKNYTDYSKQECNNEEQQSIEDDNINNLGKESGDNKPTESPETVDNNKIIKAEVVNCDLLNVRSKPSKGSEVLTIINKGDNITIIESSGNYWTYVELSDNTCGYVMSEYIQEV